MAWLPSAKPFQIGSAWQSAGCTDRAALPGKSGGGWTLGTADIRALTAFSLRWLSVWKSPFFYLVFLPLLSLSLLIICLVFLLNTFTFKVGAVVWFFTVERSQAEMKLCSTLYVCVTDTERQKVHFMRGRIHRACGDRWRGGMAIVKWWP